jgi:hypothetical protein
VGAILGWGILSPLAKSKGWAPGPVNNWQHGSQGWVVWVGLGSIPGDSAVRVVWLILHPLRPMICSYWAAAHKRSLHIFGLSRRELDSFESSTCSRTQASLPQFSYETTLLLVSGDHPPQAKSISRLSICEQHNKVLSKAAIGSWLAGAAILCFFATFYLFGKILSIWQLLTSMFIIIPLSIASNYAMGETDNSLATSLSQ